MNSRGHHAFILASSLAPLLGVVAAVVSLWHRWVGPADLAILALMYASAGIGISTGYHRLLAHRSFKTGRTVRVVLAGAGAIAGQAPPIIWVAHHRRHHRLADRPGDPHSPHEAGRPALAGLWHAHLGWLLDRDLSSDPLRYCPDLARDRDLRFISRHFLAFVTAGQLFPALLGLAATGSAAGALTGWLWGGLVRLFVSNHVTYAVNSVGHYFGRRRFATADASRNVAWLAIPSFGEAWHNNHHAFPRSARIGMRWYEIDLAGVLIRGLEALGLAWEVQRVDPAQREHRAQAGARAAAAAPAAVPSASVAAHADAGEAARERMGGPR